MPPPSRPCDNCRSAMFLVALAMLWATTRGRADPVPSLGQAAGHAVFSLTSTSATIQNEAAVTGTIAVGPGGSLTISNSPTLTGPIYRDPTATVTGASSTPTSLSQAVTDAHRAATAYSALTATQVFGNITSSVSILGTGGLNVITVNALVLDGSDVLTLSGSASDLFILNIPARGSGNTGRVVLENDSKIVLAAGVTANHVLFNVAGGGSSALEIKNDARAQGTFLAPERSFVMQNDASLVGAVLAGGATLQLRNDAALTVAAFDPGIVPAPPSLVLLGLGGLGVLVALWKRGRLTATAAPSAR